MKQLFFTTLLMTLSTSLLFAQKGKDRHEEIQTIKIGYISKKLNLTPEQAKVFWPIYDGFEMETRTLRRKFAKQYQKENPDASRKDARTYINADINFQEQTLALRKELISELKGKISDQQIADLFIAEREFRAMLVKRLRNAKGTRRGGHRAR